MKTIGKLICMAAVVTLFSSPSEAMSQGVPIYAGAQTCPSCMGANSFSHAGACGRQCRRGFTSQIRGLRKARRNCQSCPRNRSRGGLFRRFNPCHVGQQCCPTQNYAAPVMTLPPTTSVPTPMYVPQPVTTYQNVQKTLVRREAYQTQVPVTTYQTRTQYRDVPYQVTTRVPQTRIQYVPRMSYAPQPTCNTCQNSNVHGYIPPQGQISSLPMANPMIPQNTGLPTLSHPEPVSYNNNQMVPVPTHDTNYSPSQNMTYNWQPIRSKNYSDPVPSVAKKTNGYRTLNSNYNSDIPQTASRPVKRFTAAPSAASVMRTQIR